MSNYQFNAVKSLQFAEDFRNIIQLKACYDNVYSIVMVFLRMGLEGNPKCSQYQNVRVAFGGISIQDGLLAKHCFFIEGNDIIDPTYILTTRYKNNNEMPPSYEVCCTFTITKYLDLCGTTGYTDLGEYMRDKFNNWSQKLIKKDMFLCG